MGFEKFEKGRFRGTRDALVSVRQSGSIGISKVAMAEYFDDATGVVLYYDEENNKIGLEPADVEEDPDAYKLGDADGNGTVTASSFLKRYDILPDETTSYKPEWDEDAGLVVVNLDNPL